MGLVKKHGAWQTPLFGNWTWVQVETDRLAASKNEGTGDKPAQRATAKQLAIVIASGESGLLSPAPRAPKGKQYYLPKAARTCLGLHAFAHYVGYSSKFADPLLRAPDRRLNHLESHF